MHLNILYDDSQYGPRGHYDRTEALSRYFRAMMYAGRMTFHLSYPKREVDYQGTTFVAEGGIFSYHEFAWPMADRLTDEEWQAMIATGSEPPPPGWMF